MKKLVYHRVPEDMVGTILYPLSQLKKVDSKLYKLYAAGYEGREHILKRKIDLLGCTHADAINFCPVHPQKIVDELKKSGTTDFRWQEYFEVNVETDLDINNAVIQFRNSAAFGDLSYERAAEADWNRVAVIPPITLEHYRDVARTGEPLFAWHGIPHLLYKGSVDTKKLRRIRTS